MEGGQERQQGLQQRWQRSDGIDCLTRCSRPGIDVTAMCRIACAEEQGCGVLRAASLSRIPLCITVGLCWLARH